VCVSRKYQFFFNIATNKKNKFGFLPSCTSGYMSKQWNSYVKELEYLRPRIPADPIQTSCLSCSFRTPPSLTLLFSFREL